MDMKISAEGLQFIAMCENANGPALKAIKSPERNRDGSVKYEIGFGHNSDDFFQVTPGSTITEQQAYELLQHDVAEAERRVNALVNRPDWPRLPTQYEFDAMVSAVFNGVCLDNPNKAKKTYRTLFAYFAGNASQEELGAAWCLWCKARNAAGELVILPGLEVRRNKEVDMFCRGEYGANSGNFPSYGERKVRLYCYDETREPQTIQQKTMVP